MAPDNFEEYSREKFEEREIEPSATAWTSLDAMLNKVQPQHKKKGIPWLAIAASFVGIALIATFFSTINNPAQQVTVEDLNTETLNTETKETLHQEVLIDQTHTAVVENNTPATTENENQVSTNNQLIAPVSSKRSTSISKKEPVTTTKSSPFKISEKNKHNNADIASQNLNKIVPSNTILETQNVKNIHHTNSVETTAQAIASQIKSLKNKNGHITVQEIDALLQQAQHNISLERAFVTKKVDAMALLGEVEYELEKSFKDKVFLALGEGFDQLRTAILDRNN